MVKIFLGGTCNGSKWRDNLIPLLKEKSIDYFNPVVNDWTEECQIEEERQKELCDFHLYVLTPKMTGVFSIAEVVDSSNKNPLGTIFVVLENDDGELFNKGQLMSLFAVKKMVKNNGGYVCNNLTDFIDQIKVLTLKLTVLKK